MRPPADCFILYGTHSPLSSIPFPDADRIHHPGPPPECRRAGSDPDSARRTSVVASDATLPRTLRPVGLAQRHRLAQGHGLPLALAETPGPGAPGAAAAPASFGQSPAQPPRRRSAPRDGPPPRRVGGVAPVPPGSPEAGLFQFLLQRHHYLGQRNCVGENLKYLVRERHGRPVACLLFGSAAWDRK